VLKEGRVVLRYLKTIIILPLFVFCLFIISSCGIENIPQLNPPTVIHFPSAGDNKFYFSSPEDNNEVKGFELYYNFYSKDSPSETDDRNLEDSLGNDIITNHGFHRIYSYLDSSTDTYNKPLIPIERLYRGTNYDIVIHFDTLFSSQISEPYAELSFSSEHIELRRDVMDPIYGGLKRFSDFANGDSDLPDDISDISKSDELDVILYAASYGYDLTTGAIVYSKCKYLGLITLDLVKIRL